MSAPAPPSTYMTLRHRRGLATARLGLSYSLWLAESYQVYCFLPVTSALHLIYFRRTENKGPGLYPQSRD